MRGSERLVDRVQALAMLFRKSGIQKRGRNILFAFTLFVLLFGLTNTLYAGAEDDAYSVDQGATVNGNVLDNDRALLERNHVVTTTGSFTTPKGSYTLTSDGSLAYTANPLATGTDSFEYEIFYQSWSLLGILFGWRDRTDDATVTITINTPIVENANDLCYGEIIEEPLDDNPYFHKRTVPILNQGEGNLTEVNLIFATNGLLDIVQMDFDCGIDDQSKIGSGECAYADTNGIGNLGLELDWLVSTTILHDVIHYAMPDYEAYDPHSIYHKHGDNVDLSGTQIYAMYIKDNTLYRGRIDSCDISSNPPFQNEYTCGTFPSVLTSYEHMTLSRNQIFNSCTISYPEGQFSQDHNNAPVCYTDLTTSELCEDLDGIAENGNCNFVPEPTNRYDHDFIETTDNSDSESDEDIELTQLQYGNYTFDGNDQVIHFNPSKTYSNSDKKVMLLGDVTLTQPNQELIFEEGDYYFRSLDIQQNNLQIEPRGNVRIFIRDDLTYRANNAKTTDPASSLFFYVGGDMTLSSGGGGNGDIAAFFYVEGDVEIKSSSNSTVIYGAITAEGRIDITGNNINFEYNEDGANKFGMGKCVMCYDPPRGPNGINFFHIMSFCTPFTPCDIYVPVRNLSSIPLDAVQVVEAQRSLAKFGWGSNHEVVDKDENPVPGTGASKESSLYLDLPMGFEAGLNNGYVSYNIGDAYPVYAPDETYYQIHKQINFSMNVLDFSQLVYFGKYLDDVNRSYNVQLDLCQDVEIPPSFQTGPFDAWDTFRGDTDGDGKFDDKNISTKIAGKTFSLTIANLDADQTGVEAKSISSTVTYGLYDGTTLINGTVDTFDIKTTTAITKTYNDVSLASRNVHVGFTFCSLFDGTTYTLLEDSECAGNDIALCKNIDNSNPKWRKCYSSDAFAIRPKAFEITPPSGEDIGLLTSGSTYRFTVVANKENNTPTDGYNQEDNNLTIAQRLLFSNGKEDNQSILHGTLSFSNNNFLFVDGISTHRDDAAKTETVGITFSDVGRVDIILEDRQWGSVDSDDTPQGCNGGTLTNAKGIMLTIPDGTHICGENAATFIPERFDLTGITLRNHNNEGNFTYLSNDLNMSAHLDVQISAMNAQGAVTQNFREGALFYENPVSVDLNVTDWNASLPNRHPLDNSVNIKDIPTETLLGFGGADEVNGKHTITYASQRLLVNYQRNNNEPVNPFMLPGSDINISVASTYQNEESGATRTVTGSGAGGADSNATFYFGRAKASQDFYDVKGTVADTPITVQVYCSNSNDFQPTDNAIMGGNPLYCTSFLIDDILLFGQTDQHGWWLSLGHNQALGDGDITLDNPGAVLGSGSGSVVNDVDDIANGVDDNITVKHNSGALPVTYDINLTLPTDSWLIYNADSPLLDPDPFYKVRFTGDSGWAGVGATGHVLDINASGTETKRLNW